MYEEKVEGIRLQVTRFAAEDLCKFVECVYENGSC